MYVKLPELTVESVETTRLPVRPATGYADTTVHEKYREAPINIGFTTALFVNEKQVGSYSTNGLQQESQQSGQ